MPKLAVIDHVVSAAGVERFLHGLVGGLLTLPEMKSWEITLLLKGRNSGGYEVKWPEHLTAPNLQVRYLCGDRLSNLLENMAAAQRVWGIPGTAKAQHLVPQFIRQYGPPELQGYVGDVRSWIERFCRQHRFDVVYFSYPYLLDAPRLPMPMVSTPHDFNYKRFETLGPVLRAQIERQMPGWLRACRRLVVSSEFIAGEVRHFYPEFMDKVSVIRLGIPQARRVPTEAEVAAYRERLGLPAQFLLTSGWIIPHKNQRVLFEALGRLRGRGIDIPLVCVGPNSQLLQPDQRSQAEGYVKEVVEAADRAGLQYGRDYRGLGYVDDFELECLYRLAVALITPTLYEGGGFPTREAMRAGCPVACSRIPPLVEEANLLERTAWMFDPADAQDVADIIEALLTDPVKTAEQARRAAEIVTQVFSWEKTAAGYFSVFQELAG